MPWVLPLNSDQAALPLVGGKAANLARLARAGFPVPAGFFISVDAYHAFVDENQLAEQIEMLLPSSPEVEMGALEAASSRIRGLFFAGRFSERATSEIVSAYHEMGGGAVAVRSSATAEDLPELSFAGQQDTYLNVVGETALRESVVRCWSSLWTARAIGYRLRNQVAPAGIGLGVVVQHMVDSQAAGVLFTANPLTGLRAEMVIDAAFGLGESLVSGRVEPDHYRVDPANQQILSKTLGRKCLSIHVDRAGGTWEREQERATMQALPDPQILALADLGKQVETLYGFPQDIEWAWDGARLALLQSRPITSLYPLPDGTPPEPLKVLFSFAAIQGIMEPMTTTGMDAIRWISAMINREFDRFVTAETQGALHEAGARLWANITPLLRNRLGRKVLPTIFGLVEPTVRQALQQIWEDPRLQPGRRSLSPKTARSLVRIFAPVAFNVALNLAAPRRRRQYIIGRAERLLEQLEHQRQAVCGDQHAKLAQRIALYTKLLEKELLPTFLLFVSGVASGMAAWNLMNRLAGGDDPAVRDLALQMTRGMPNNPTTQMDLDLWKVARALRDSLEARAAFQQFTPPELAHRYQAESLPGPLMEQIGRFLQRYGGRGYCEIDMGRERWAENPTHVFEMLGSFLQIEDERRAPDAVFAQAADSAAQAVDALVCKVRELPRGKARARLVRFCAGRARQLMGMRENPKFFAVRMMWTVRRALLESGVELCQAGELALPEDVFFLKFSELDRLAAGQPGEWSTLAAARRAAWQRELRRRLIPRLLLSDGRAFYEGIGAGVGAPENRLAGSPVSPGRVEGNVRVVLDPRQAGLLPGEILVCPGTDPSWTPLFLTAAGLVMETGGMMTHGAVVAREYGIPAVVGVDRATHRLHTGQRIQLDGSSGLILLVDAAVVSPTSQPVTA